MKMKNDKYQIADSKSVDELINDYYAEDYHEMNLLLERVAKNTETEVNISKIVTNSIEYREKLRDDVVKYEDQLVQLLDLATVLSDYMQNGHYNDFTKYVNYMIEKNLEILPDVVEMIQLIKK